MANLFPYSNFHDLNLDWILDTVKDAKEKVEEIPEKVAEGVSAGINSFNVTTEVSAKLEEMLANGELNSIVQSIMPEKYIFIGDSFALGHLPDSEIREGWVKYCIDSLGLSASEYYTVMQGGTGFATNNSINTFQNMLESLETTIPESDRPFIRHIVVCGGTNDIANYENVAAGIGAFMAASAIYPNAKVHVGFLYNHIVTTNYLTERQNAGRCLKAYQNCGLYGAGYMTNIEDVLLAIPSTLSSDNMHPNAFGYQVLGGYIASAITSGSVDVSLPWTAIPVTVNSDVFNDGASIALRAIVSHGVLSWFMQISGATTLKTNYTIYPDSRGTYIGTFTPGAPIRGEWGYWQDQPSVGGVFIDTTGALFQPNNVHLKFTVDGKIYICTSDIKDGAYANYVIQGFSSNLAYFVGSIPLWNI